MKFEPVKNNNINKISGRWISERELALYFNRAFDQDLESGGRPRILTPGVRRNISQSRHPDGAAVVLGANCVHITWNLESSARKLAWESQALIDEAIQWLDALLQDDANQNSDSAATSNLAAKKILITTKYGDAANISHDLEKLARENQMTTAEILKRHLATTYVVAFSGFQPGFAYLEPLEGSPGIIAPRHETPRTKVPAGAVALGGAYCGIYPADGPGGWNIIGLTAMRFLDPTSGSDAWLPGDLVQFVEEIK
ncbi:MAG: carboxyltransferase domain-containing protein [Proteobacteria bacterium]|nr:carboxyltransferase domain-containing protein [Pseudomonadota bacterium]